MTMSADDMNPDDCMLNARKEVIENLKSPNRRTREEDTAQLITMVRAIIATNEEIWDRCKEYRHKYRDRNDAFNDSCEEMTFKRVMFNVHVKKMKDNDECDFRVLHEIERKNFERPPSLPKNLKDATTSTLSDGKSEFDDAAVVTDPTSIFEMYLKRCLVLHQEIVPHALIQFKDWLESVQVHFGKIEGWIMESVITQAFLKETFEALGFTLGITVRETWWLNFGVYKCNLPVRLQVLMTYQPSVKFFLTFDIQKQIEQERLKSFIDFLSLYHKE